MDNNNTMEYRIGLEKQNKHNSQVTELILDNCRASQISGLTDEFVNLEALSLINVGLVTLKGFPKLPKLKKLELSDNRLTGGLNLLHGSPKLQHLNISGNRIKDLEALEPLKEFHELVNLDLYNCEVTKSDEYRRRVFELIPNLRSLDGYDRNEREVADSDESEDEGSDAENRITREDNLDDLDDDEDGDDDDDDESSDYDEEEGEFNGLEPAAYDEEDDEDDDEDDEDDDDEDDDGDDEEYDDEASQNVDGFANRAGAVAEGSNAKNDDSSENVENGDDDGDGADDDEDDEEDGDLKLLQKEIKDDDSEDDDDFEPSHEPDARDYEIDPEDDADEDESGAYLSTSNLSAAATSGTDDLKHRGQKRKHEDEGGDEAEGE